MEPLDTDYMVREPRPATPGSRFSVLLICLGQNNIHHFFWCETWSDLCLCWLSVFNQFSCIIEFHFNFGLYWGPHGVLLMLCSFLVTFYFIYSGCSIVWFYCKIIRHFNPNQTTYHLYVRETWVIIEVVIIISAVVVCPCHKRVASSRSNWGF